MPLAASRCYGMRLVRLADAAALTVQDFKLPVAWLIGEQLAMCLSYVPVQWKKTWLTARQGGSQLHHVGLS